MSARKGLCLLASVTVLLATFLTPVATAQPPNISFTRHTIAEEFNYANSVHATDVDGDGDVDILGGAGLAGGITWWENDGNENFAEHVIADGLSGESVYATDVDGDGDVDVLGASNYADDITWWENDGAENFTEHTIAGDFDGARSVYATDLDGDGDTDVLGAAYWADKIAWWENDGSENFTQNPIDDACYGAESVYATDLDDDGDVDALGVCSSSARITWWENYGAENFIEHTIDGSVSGAVPVYATDVDGDADVDVLGSASLGDITWWENDGGENFIEHTIAGDFDGANSVYATDVDGDGDVDVLGTADALASAAEAADYITWWENDGVENFLEHPIGCFDGAASVYATDLDGDGDVDVLGAAATAADITWWEQGAGPGSTPPTIEGLLDHDLIENTHLDNAIDLWEHAEDAESADGELIFTIDNGPDPDAGVTIDGNRYVDIYPTPGWTGRTEVVICTTDPGGLCDKDGFVVTVSKANKHTIARDFDGAISVYATDVDGDGDTDVLGAAYVEDHIAWWENNGDGRFVWHFIGRGGYPEAPFCVYATDLDSDGDMDVLAAASSDFYWNVGEIAWWENDGDESFTKHHITNDFYGARSVYATDIDGDGDMDVVGAGRFDDDIAWWENDGAENFTEHTIAGDFVES